MASLEDLYAHIPTAQIAQQLGVDEDTAQNAIQSVLPQLLGGLHQQTQDPEKEAALNAAAEEPGTDEADGHALVNSLFGSDNAQVASALSAGNSGVDSGLAQKLLPILLPIVVGYLGKKALGGGDAAGAAQSGAGGGLVGELLGGILSGAGGQAGGGALGSILGSVLGGGSAPAPQQPQQQEPQNNSGGILGQVLGGLFNRK